MKNFRKILWGLVLVAIGIIIGLNQFGITDINIFFRGWWTLFIIIPCFIDLFKEDDKTGNFIGLLIGVVLLLETRSYINFEIIRKLLFPTILVIIGLSFIFKNIISARVDSKVNKKGKNKKNTRECCATFSGEKLDFTGEPFEGCDVSAIFGGIKCNLVEATIKNDAVINATAIFGGVDIMVPEDVNVKINSTSIFGGVSNKTKNGKDGKKTIYINATCLFGGVDIK